MKTGRARGWAGRTGVLGVLVAVCAPPLGAQVPGEPFGSPLASDLSPGDRTSLGLTAGVAIPRGASKELKGVGFEVTAHVLVVNRAGWLGLRVSGAGALHRAVDSPLIGGGRLSLRSRTATLDIGPQLVLPRGSVRPYGYAAVGGVFVLTDPSIDGTIYPVSQPAGYSDLSHLFKVGGGLYVPLHAGSRSISLDMGVHLRWNGDTRFLGGDGVVVAAPGDLGLSLIDASGSVLVLSLGVVVGLP